MHKIVEVFNFTVPTHRQIKSCVKKFHVYDNRNWGKKLPQNFISSRYGQVKTQNKAEMKTWKKTTLLWNNGRKERQEGYLTSASHTADIG